MRRMFPAVFSENTVTSLGPYTARVTRRFDPHGDFQTPDWLADRVADLTEGTAASVVEPTCGRGSILAAALKRNPGARGLGLELQPQHLEVCRQRLEALGRSAELELGDVFAVDWRARLAELPEPICVVGNPPWVTNAAIGRAGADNLPAKSTARLVAGDPRTGASNFDVCEWILVELAGALAGRTGSLVMLCKTQVARRVLSVLWTRGPQPASAEIFTINAREAFAAAVDACVLVLGFGRSGPKHCAVYPALSRDATPTLFGDRDGILVADLETFDRYQHLCTSGSAAAVPAAPRWRSGVKHDCAAIMELSAPGDLEPRVLYPMLKSSELARGSAPSRLMLIPQRAPGEDPATLAELAPRAWAYLQAHGERLDRRKSRVYRKRPRFSIFGVGPYTFAPWKVAISGFYKHLSFRLIGPHQGRPVVFDDTCYFLSFTDRAAATRAHALLSSEPAQALLGSLTFWDAKRPITARLLSRLVLPAVEEELRRARP